MVFGHASQAPLNACALALLNSGRDKDTKVFCDLLCIQWRWGGSDQVGVGLGFWQRVAGPSSTPLSACALTPLHGRGKYL